jgi:type IV secretory pathway VirB10-like protein
MTDFSAETSQLLDRAREAGGLSDERRARIKTSVLTQVAAVGIAGSIGIGSASLASAAGASKGTGLIATLVKAVSAVALLAAAGAGVYSVARPAPAPAPKPPTTQVAAPAVAPSAKPEPEKRAEPSVAEELEAPAELEPALPAPGKPAPGARTAGAAPVTAETLAEETRLLREADQALRSGNAARALSLLDEHQSRFPRGVLSPARRAERLLARCQLGHVDAKAVQAYLASHPGSAFVTRIRDACTAK